jgi:hypothetical protein
MSPKGIISTMAVEDAVNMLSAAEYGIHCLIVYPDLTTLREFYSHYIHKQVEVRNEAVKMASFYETLDSVRRTLSKVHPSMDVGRLERERTLSIVDSLNEYFADGEYVKFDFDAYKTMIGKAKTLGKSGCSVLGDTGAFPYQGRTHDLVEHEMFIPSTFDVDMKGICLYHQQDLNRLEAEQKKKLVEHHGMAIRIVQRK